RQPQHAIRSIRAPSVEPAVRTYLRKSPTQPGHVTDEIGETFAFAPESFPADPADFVVLAIGIVVAGLGVADFIAGQNQRQALRQQQAGKLILPKLTA